MTLFAWMGRFSAALERPFSVRWTPHTIKFMLAALVAYGFAVVLYLSTRENRRPGEEHGSAKWGSAKRLNAKYRDKDPRNNTILTQNVRMSLNGKMHRRNLLQIVIGGSGAGKTRFFVKPNLMEANCSFLVTDPKGETLRAVAPLLIQKGYVIKVFDLIDPSHSDSFNALAYIRDDKDVMKLVNNFIKNTTPKGAQQNDPFWERSEIALDTALILYLIHEAPPEEQNFEMLIYMIENGGAKEDDDDYQSPLDLLFEALEEEYPDHIAVREYKIYKQAAGKTAKSILISAAVRLSAFIVAVAMMVDAVCSLASWRRLSDQLERVRADLADRINESLADASDSMLERIPDSAIDSVAQTHIRGRAVNAWLAELGDAALDALREKASMPTFISDGARGLALAARRVADVAPSMPRPSLSRRLAGKRMSRPVPSVSLSRRDLRFFNAFPRLRINRYEGVIRATDLRDRARELFRR